MSTPLAVRLPNWVGDVVMALPALHALHAAGFTCHCVGRSWATDLLASCPWRVTAAGRGVRAGARALRATGARKGLLFTNSLGTALAARLGGVRAVGYAGDLRSPLLARALPRRATGHEVEHYWALAAAVRDRWAPTAPFPDSPSRTARLSPTPEHRRAAADALTATGVGPGYVALCPAATGTIAGASKVWPHWRACSEILAKRDLPLVVCPGPGEEEQCARSAPRATQLSGLGLGAYAAVLAGARRVLANDSGPMHLAAGVGAPTLGIFGVGDPQRTRPWGQHAIGDATGWPTVAAVIAAFDALPRSTGP